MKTTGSKTYKLLIKLFNSLPKKRKKHLILLMPIAIISGLADVFVVTFVARLFNAFVGIPNEPSIPFSDDLNIDPIYKILGLVILYVISTWVAALIKLFLKGSQFKLKAKIWRDLSEIAHRNILLQKYEYFINANKNDISSNILLNISRVSDIVVLPLLQLISGFIVVIFISFAVLSIAKTIALYLIISMLIGFTAISLLVTPFLRKAARKRIDLVNKTNNILRESMGTILDVHLTSSESFFEKQYSSKGRESIPYIWKAETLPEMPRALLEPFGITLIFAIGLFPFIFKADSPNDLNQIIPFLATIAVASLKLTPPLQDSFRAYTSLRAGLPELAEILKIIELPKARMTIRSKGVPNPDLILPKKEIKLQNVFYSYPGSSKEVLNKINLNIKKGSTIAFVGKTGSGKTTTANILLGLLKPTSGRIFLDNYNLTNKDIPAWQFSCAYVPQTITLLNSDIVSNVAYGIEKESINVDKVWEALNNAKLSDMVLDMPNKIYTKIGDNGIKISGGQRQRLAIARALYRNAKFIILDEATSSLDNKTEFEVMEAIENIGRKCTVVIIAHRLSTVMRADNIYEFADGTIKAFGNFIELQNKSETFKQLIRYESGISIKEDKIF